MAGFDGLDLNMGNLYRLSETKTRSISPENIHREPGRGRTGPKDRCAGCPVPGAGLEDIAIHPDRPGESRTLADIEGPGVVQHAARADAAASSLP